MLAETSHLALSLSGRGRVQGTRSLVLSFVSCRRRELVQ